MLAAAPTSVSDWIIFWVMAPVSVASAVAVILARNAVHSALLLIVNFFTIAVFFLVLGAQWLFIVQIIVYAGAIMVLFLFVIMLLGVDRRESLREQILAQRWLALLLGGGLIAEVALAVRAGVGFTAHGGAGFAAANRGGNIQALPRVLFSSYFFPFEVTSVLLIVAAIGAMLHGRRRISGEEVIDAPAADAGRSPELDAAGYGAAPSPELVQREGERP